MAANTADVDRVSGSSEPSNLRIIAVRPGPGDRPSWSTRRRAAATSRCAASGVKPGFRRPTSSKSLFRASSSDPNRSTPAAVWIGTKRSTASPRLTPVNRGAMTPITSQVDVVHAQRAREHVGIADQGLLPVAMADEDLAVASGPGVNDRAQRGAHAERIEEVVGDGGDE